MMSLVKLFLALFLLSSATVYAQPTPTITGEVDLVAWVSVTFATNGIVPQNFTDVLIDEISLTFEISYERVVLGEVSVSDMAITVIIGFRDEDQNSTEYYYYSNNETATSQELSDQFQQQVVDPSSQLMSGDLSNTVRSAESCQWDAQANKCVEPAAGPPPTPQPAPMPSDNSTTTTGFGGRASPVVMMTLAAMAAALASVVV
jgi:hypothetical protein